MFQSISVDFYRYVFLFVYFGIVVSTISLNFSIERSAMVWTYVQITNPFPNSNLYIADFLHQL